METELKEGDEVVLRGKVTEAPDEDGNVEVTLENGRRLFFHPAYVYKVRPGTYEVTARDVAKMICRIMRLNAWNYRLWAEQGVLLPSHFKKLRRWVHCRLRELRRKRGER